MTRWLRRVAALAVLAVLAACTLTGARGGAPASRTTLHTVTASQAASRHRAQPARSSRAVLPHPVPGRPQAAPVTASTGSDATVTVIVLRWGDTLWALAQRYHTSVRRLQDINELADPSLIYAGNRLHVPATTGTPAVSHDAQTDPAATPGTLRSIAGATAAITFAIAQLGKPYRWGATGPDAYDCSGLVQAAWRAAGVELPRTTYQQALAGTPTTRDRLTPGDLVFSNDFGHVQLYLGRDLVLEAPYTGAAVRYAALPPASQINAYRHILASRLVSPAAASTVTPPRAAHSAPASTTHTPAAAPTCAAPGTPRGIGHIRPQHPAANAASGGPPLHRTNHPLPDADARHAAPAATRPPTDRQSYLEGAR